MDDIAHPLRRTDSANLWFTAFLVSLGLLMLIGGNNDGTDGVNFAGFDVKGALNNVGLAIIIAALTLFFTDFRVRERFYRDITDHVVANQSVRSARIASFFSDSKTCIPERLLQTATSLDVGMVYSNRLLKDHIGILEDRGKALKIRIFCPDFLDPDVIKSIAFNTSQSDASIVAEYEKLQAVIKSISDAGVTVEYLTQKAMPHYSFYVIDNAHFFFTFGSFASRRTNVPLLQVYPDSAIAKLILGDIKHIVSQQAPPPAAGTP
jgi:hypothetical protein